MFVSFRVQTVRKYYGVKNRQVGADLSVSQIYYLMIFEDPSESPMGIVKGRSLGGIHQVI